MFDITQDGKRKIELEGTINECDRLAEQLDSNEEPEGQIDDHNETYRQTIFDREALYDHIYISTKFGHHFATIYYVLGLLSFRNKHEIGRKLFRAIFNFKVGGSELFGLNFVSRQGKTLDLIREL